VSRLVLVIGRVLGPTRTGKLSWCHQLVDITRPHSSMHVSRGLDKLLGALEKAAGAWRLVVILSRGSTEEERVRHGVWWMR
jgi:hypothetical protein